MNYDKLYVLIDELRPLEKRAEEIRKEINALTGGSSAPAPAKGKSVATLKAAALKPSKRKTPGDLQPLVLKVLAGYRTHKTIDEIHAKVLKTRPNTKKASVGAVLAGLASRGKVVKGPDGFFLPVDAPTGVNPSTGVALGSVPTPVTPTAPASAEPLED